VSLAIQRRSPTWLHPATLGIGADAHRHLLVAIEPEYIRDEVDVAIARAAMLSTHEIGGIGLKGDEATGVRYGRPRAGTMASAADAGADQRGLGPFEIVKINIGQAVGIDERRTNRGAGYERHPSSIAADEGKEALAIGLVTSLRPINLPRRAAIQIANVDVAHA
jgi:hypothetical protein